jgi:hypothetical protein
MRLIFPVVTVACIMMTAIPSHASRVHRGPTAGKHRTTKAATKGAAVHQRAMDDARATQIQGALVKSGYLQESSGHWDSTSEAAMQKLQADNGWQTKIIPDSRALIKLGLGPTSTASSATPQASSVAVSGSAAETDALGSK